MFSVRPSERGGIRTAAAQEPDMTHPMRCASQLMPLEDQKLVWSTSALLSDGQDDEPAIEEVES